MTLLARSAAEPALAPRLAALDRIVALGPARLDPDALATAERLSGKAAQRLRLGAEHTVVALAGTTGSGKSSLFNALVGTELAATGLRRPVTSTAQAAIWDPDGAAPLLDWLGVQRRHHLGDEGADDLAGLVLLDLPDVDSVKVNHRLEVDRLVELVDLVIWVVDPQKYADSALHDHYLRPLRTHADVTVVAFNQIDRVPTTARDGVLADLRGLLQREGLDGVPVLPVSARTGDGVPALRSRLVDAVAAHEASVRRLNADLRALGDELEPVCGPSGASDVDRADRAAVIGALTEASGADAVALAVARTHRSRTRAATGWPMTRWLARVRPSAATRLGLPGARLGSGPDNPSELVRTALPGPSAVQQARVDTALRNLVDRTTAGLPDPWPTVLTRAATGRREQLPDLLDRAVAGADLGLARRPRWWALIRVVQNLLALTALAGALWLIGLFVLDWFRLPEPPLPDLEAGGWDVPVPTAMLLGGVVVGLILGFLSARLGAFGARRRAALARRRIRSRVEQVAAEAVLEPVAAELSARGELCTAISRLRARR
ncbi:GTPase [Cryptosporangium aurantiacum]|uniref:50S ribosome-binding GTPase n=1 Tax=Cryptosporangium aurantiacum TaxID=134849 RepID=A0A1M7NR43_9ACTN|nr:GTPase [Cryptosporangium aurantiacum]SHN06491.1 50S ribosome-binding GTPase [Cryptosporangium aurantiacum]